MSTIQKLKNEIGKLQKKLNSTKKLEAFTTSEVPSA